MKNFGSNQQEQKKMMIESSHLSKQNIYNSSHIWKNYQQQQQMPKNDIAPTISCLLDQMDKQDTLLSMSPSNYPSAMRRHGFVHIDKSNNNHLLTTDHEAAQLLLRLSGVTQPYLTMDSSSPIKSKMKRPRQDMMNLVNNDGDDNDSTSTNVQRQSEQQSHQNEEGKRYGCQCAIRFQYEIQVSCQMKFVSCLKCLRARAQFYLGPRYYARGIKMRVKPEQMKEENRSTIVWGDIIHKYHLQNVFQCIEKHYVVKIPASVNNLHDTLLFLGDKFPCTFEELLKVSHVPIISCDPRKKISEIPVLIKEEAEEDDAEDVEPERKIAKVGVQIC